MQPVESHEPMVARPILHADALLVPAPGVYGPAVAIPRGLVPMPAVKQQTNFSCGNAATLSMLRHWRLERFAGVDETALYAPLGTTRAEGTEPEPIVAYLEGVAGLEAVYRHGDVTVEELERAVDLRQPPIVDLQAWRDDELPWRDVWDSGHYVIMVGYDAERLFFMDPSRMTPGAYAYLLRSELEERWHDLAGRDNIRLSRMAIFVRGTPTPDPRTAPPGETATKLA